MAGVKPSAISSATVAAFKTKLGYLTQAEADLRYPQISEGEPVDLDALLAAKADLASPTFTGTPLVPTAEAGTKTTQAASTAFVEESVSNPAFMSGISAAGSTVKLLPLVLFAPGASTYTMVDGRALYILADLKYPRTLTGIRTALATAGDYTADNFNGIALYSIASDGTATRVAISADTPNCWKTTAGSELVIPFTAPYNAPAGLYAIHAIYNSSAQTTAPVLMTGSTLTNGSPNNAFGLLNSIKFSGYAAETTPPESITYSSITGLINIPVLLGY